MFRHVVIVYYFPIGVRKESDRVDGVETWHILTGSRLKKAL